MDAMGEQFTLALDDADSPRGGCTTHLLGLVLARLRGRIRLLDYPLLIRLAPGVPWKTRGNAAVVLRAEAVRGSPRDVLEEAWSLAREYSSGRSREPGKGPGIAMILDGEPWRRGLLARLYREAVRGLVSPRAVEAVARREGLTLLGGRGRVGAAAALAALGPGEEYTYELIAYRRPELWGEERCVLDDPGVEAGIPACAFNNIDLPARRTAAAPHGPDPVLAGFRGTCPGGLGCYASILCEEPHFWVLYRSNQHTDAHARHPLRPRPYESGRALLGVEGLRVLPGGHALARARLGGEELWVAAYRESGPVRRALELVGAPSMVELHGTLHPREGGPTLSVEALHRAVSRPRTVRLAPRCPRCGRRMKSAGRGKGYKCPSCGYRDRSAAPLEVALPPRASSSRVTPTPLGISHLTRPSHVYKLPSGPPRPPSYGEVFSPGREPPEGTRTLCRHSF